MNGKRAKQQRRDGRLVEIVLQAHDWLHKDDVDDCHELLHAALGSGEVDSSVAPLAPGGKFDAAFRRLCIAHGVQAAYVLAEDAGAGRARLLSGGDGDLCALVDNAVRRSVP